MAATSRKLKDRFYISVLAFIIDSIIDTAASTGVKIETRGDCGNSCSQDRLYHVAQIVSRGLKRSTMDITTPTTSSPIPKETPTRYSIHIQ